MNISSVGGLVSNINNLVCGGNPIGHLLCQIQQLLNSVIPVLIVLGVVYFVWGVVQYMIGDSEEAKTKGRNTIIYGIIGFAIIIGLWGLVNLVVSTFNLGAKAPDLSQVAFSGTPVSAGACSTGNAAGDLLCNIKGILNSILPVLMALGMVYFVWGVVQYVIGDSEEAKTKGRNRIIYGIIGFAIIASLTGIVNLVVSTLKLDNTAPQLVPLVTVPGPGCSLGEGAFQDYLKFATCTINDAIIPFIFAVAVIMFIWGVFKFFILNADEEAKRTQGKQFMVWGIVALAVMLSVWGLVNVLRTTFNVKTGSSVLPQVHP